MVECTIFELSLELKEGNDSPQIEYLIRTDLPQGAFVILSCQRTYKNDQGIDSLWIGYNDRLTIVELSEGHRGVEGTIDVHASDSKARTRFLQLTRSRCVGAPVSDLFTIELVAGGRQRLREFGRNNSNLTGKLVSEMGGLRFVEASNSLIIPMHPDLQPPVGMSMEDDDE